MSTEAGTVYVGAIALLSDKEKENDETDEATYDWVITMYNDKMKQWCYWEVFDDGHDLKHAETWRDEPPYIIGPAGSILFGKVRHEKANHVMDYMRTATPWHFKSDFQVIQYLFRVWQAMKWVYEGVEDVGDFDTHAHKAEKEIREAMDRTRVHRRLAPIPRCRTSWNRKKSLLDIVYHNK
ncbi:hypothetical protein J3458_001651 [Metarhizium acridum]|uniref:uncharacterized protein n=1 Tax=Metarhizium acridum TaxID=92637 RepID=UPI001C6CCCF3|nr:hypothetical protein J3458_001651 [Metarhizium acridum]